MCNYAEVIETVCHIACRTTVNFMVFACLLFLKWGLYTKYRYLGTVWIHGYTLFLSR